VEVKTGSGYKINLQEITGEEQVSLFEGTKGVRQEESLPCMLVVKKSSQEGYGGGGQTKGERKDKKSQEKGSLSEGGSWGGGNRVKVCEGENSKEKGREKSRLNEKILVHRGGGGGRNPERQRKFFHKAQPLGKGGTKSGKRTKKKDLREDRNSFGETPPTFQ